MACRLSLIPRVCTLSAFLPGGGGLEFLHMSAPIIGQPERQGSAKQGKTVDESQGSLVKAGRCRQGQSMNIGRPDGSANTCVRIA